MIWSEWYGRALAHIAALIAVVLAMGGVAAHAQPHPSAPYYAGDPDEATLEIITPGLEARLDYHNSANQSSFNAPTHVQNGDLRVGLHILLAAGPEVVTVRPPAGWFAIPASMALEDGETGTFFLFRGEYLGS